MISFYQPVEPWSNERVVVSIPPGSSTRDISRILKRNGLIKNELVFRYLARWSGKDGVLKAGEYELSPSMPLSEILERLAQGKVIAVTFTIPEGFTVGEVIALLSSKRLAEKGELEAVFRDGSFLASLLPENERRGIMAAWKENPGAMRYPFEGYIFPDTYQVQKGIGAEGLARLMVRRLLSVWDAGMQERAAQVGMSLHQVLTLASIVEREAKVDAERPVIAGVYWNRLRKGMKLDADPTVRYAVRKPSAPLTAADLKQDSAYNTYLRTGLPPGPIASPGLQSIRAVLYPADVPYFYFVARQDGTHVFARTLEEQNRNINRIRRERR